MQLEDIYSFFENLPPSFLNQELAVCFVLSVLLQQDSYGTELIQLIEKDYPQYRLSDTILYSAFNFLEHQQVITSYWKRLEGRGRPRRMFKLIPAMQPKAEELANLWTAYTAERFNSTAAK